MSALLRTALHAYPRDVRLVEGEVLFALALDMVEGGSSPLREAGGLVLGGLRARFGVHRVGSLPWTAALRLLGLPLAGLLLAVVVAAASARTQGIKWVGWWLTSAMCGSGLAVAGIAFGRRRPAVLGALVLCLSCAAELRGQVRWPATVEVGSAALRLPAYWLYQPALGLCTLAALVLLACAAVTEPPAGPSVRRLAWTLAGTAVSLLVAALAARTTYVNGVAAVLAIAIVAAIAALAGLLRRGGAHRLAATLGLAAAAPPIALAVGYSPASRTHDDGIAALIAFTPPIVLALLVLSLLHRVRPELEVDM